MAITSDAVLVIDTTVCPLKDISRNMAGMKWAFSVGLPNTSNRPFIFAFEGQPLSKNQVGHEVTGYVNIPCLNLKCG
jgi:hypothetical protein